MKLKGKVALITGASRGIGKAIALEFAREGALIAVNYNKSMDKALELVDRINAEAIGFAFPIEADITDLVSAHDMIAKIFDAYALDILVNNAGINYRNNFLESNEEIWNSVMDTNLKAAFFCSRFAVEYMISQGSGNIINIASVSGIRPRYKNGIEYGISKAAVIHMTKSLAVALAPYNIRVNAIAPGYTETEMARFHNKPEVKAMIEEKIPLGNVNQPEDIAKAALFLASDDSRNIIGEIMIIDGGSTYK